MNKIFSILFFIFFYISISHSQFYYFGHNKVQYTNFDWHILHTEHFDIYYYPEMKELAQQGAFFAEESFKLLEQKFNHTILRRIPLIFYSSHLHFQQTNTTGGFIPEGVGGFFEFLKGRVVIPSDGSLSRFRHVIRHELVHVFMHSKVSRVLADRRIAADRLPPLWFTEGLAELWSTQWDDQAEMLIRDAVLNNYIVPVDDMEKIYGTFLMYKEGQNVLEFIQQQYGEEKILLLMENFWQSRSFSEVMKITIGKSYEELDEEWIYSLKKKYYPLLSSTDYVSIAANPLVKKGFNTKPVFYNNNGKKEIYFIGNYTGYTSIYKIDMEDKERELEEIIVGEKSDEFETFHLFQSKLDISKEGKLIFVTKKGESDAIHIFDVHTKTLLRTLQFENLVVLTSPHWSPDATQIIFSSIHKSGKMDLYKYEFASEKLTRLTNDTYDDRDPVWSADGKYITFSSDRNEKGIYNLFNYENTTGKIYSLTSGKENYYSPSYSPDGKYLTFVSNLGGSQNIWMMEKPRLQNTTVMKRITSFSNTIFDPCWTNDNQLIFTGFENYSFRLYNLDSISVLFDTSKIIQGKNSTQFSPTWFAEKLQEDSIVHSLEYKGEYSLDIAQSQVSLDPVFGTSGGAVAAVSDVLGNDQYYFLLYNTAQSSGEFLESFNVAISKISIGQRLNYATGIFHLSGRRYDLTDPDEYFFERNYGGYFALSYPFSKFQRIESGFTFSNSDKQLFETFRPRKALLVSPSVSFVHDNSLWGPTGPIDGSRFIATAAYTYDVKYSNVHYYTLIGDYRNYLRLNQRMTLASRFQVMLNEGKEARRFFLGGSWDLRGYPLWSLRGKKIWFTSHEIRFPFIDQLAVRFPFGTMGFGSFRGAVFFDAAGVWDNNYGDTIGSVGGGLRWNFLGAFVFRFDVGKRIINDFNKFQQGWFQQFFFGWDF